MELKNSPGTSEYTLYKDDSKTPHILVCTMGKTILHYDYKCHEDLHEMLKKQGDWMELGSEDKQKNLQKKEQLKPGVGHRKILTVDGMN